MKNAQIASAPIASAMYAIVALSIGLSAAVVPASAAFGPKDLVTFDGPGFGPKDLTTFDGPGFGPADLRTFDGPKQQQDDGHRR